VTWRENRLGEPSADFAPEKTIASVPLVRSAIAADIDGDGDLDMVAASIDDDQIYWCPNRLGEPSADFGPQQYFMLAPLFAPQYSIAALASGDFDRDGDVDLVSGSWNGSQGITWYENRRNTVSQDFTAHPIDSNGVHGDSLIAADVDRDGDADVIGEFGYRAAWYENRLDEPSADFAPLRVISPEGDVLSTALADLDGDGAPDLLAADAYRDKLVWHPNRLASPSADFGPERLVAVADFSRWVSAADLDGDGDPDAVFAAPDGLRWFRNPGTDPHDPDSDGDGLSDGYEVAHGLDPLPEPEGALSLLAGIAALAALRTSSRRPS